MTYNTNIRPNPIVVPFRHECDYLRSFNNLTIRSSDRDCFVVECSGFALSGILRESYFALIRIESSLHGHMTCVLAPTQKWEDLMDERYTYCPADAHEEREARMEREYLASLEGEED